MPVMATCTFGTVVHIRPLPSFSTRHRLPVSATAKLTPERPHAGAAKLRAGPAARSGSGVHVRGGGEAFQVACEGVAHLLLVLVDGGHDDVGRGVAVELDDKLPMSLSRQRMPWRAISWLKPTSSLTMDLPLTMLLTPFFGRYRG